MIRGITRLSSVWGILAEARVGASAAQGLEGTSAAQRWSHPANAAWQQSTCYSTEEFKVGGGAAGRTDLEVLLPPPPVRSLLCRLT